jgi:general stress protein 26
MPRPMTYEEHLDEVTTLITEKYDVADEAAIQMVMRAQADDFFSGHDDDPSLCTLDRAHQDARAVFKKYGATK